MDLPGPRGGSINDDHIEGMGAISKAGHLTRGKMDTSRHIGISHAVAVTNYRSEAGVRNLTLRSICEQMLVLCRVYAINLSSIIIYMADTVRPRRDYQEHGALHG